MYMELRLVKNQKRILGSGESLTYHIKNRAFSVAQIGSQIGYFRS